MAKPATLDNILDDANPEVAGIGDNEKKAIRDLFKRIDALGKAEGQGANSRPAFFREVVNAASNGLLVPQQGKSKPGEDNKSDAAVAFAKYLKARDKVALKDTADEIKSQAQQVSKLEAAIKFGALGVAGTVDPMTVMAEMDKARASLGRTGKYVDDLCTVARAQVKDPKVQLDADAIRDLLDGVEGKEPEELGELKKVLGAMSKIYNGRGEAREYAFPSQALKDAIDSVQSRINTLEHEKEVAELMTKAAALGIVARITTP